MLDKIETGRGHLEGLVEHSEGNGGESDVVILAFLCGSSRLCRLRTEGLVPMSKYWTYRSHAGVYGLNKPSNLPSTEGGFTPHYFNGWLGRETGYRPMNRSTDVLLIMSGAVFLRSSGSVHRCWWLHERVRRMGTTRRKRTSGVFGLAWEAYVSYWSDFSLQGVHQFESPQLSDISNRLFMAVIK
jgi:hypothetical protein